MSDIIRLPYCPFVSWSLDKKGKIIPKASEYEVHKIFSEEEICVVCFGGLIESVLSCSIFEYSFKKDYRNKLFWAGNSQFDEWINLNGLASISTSVDSLDIERFPAPIFISPNRFPIFNVLFGIDDNGIPLAKNSSKNKIPEILRMKDNFLFNWSENYLPKLRSIYWDPKLDIWARQNRINWNHPYYLLMPDRLNVSLNNNNFLNWGNQEIRSFISMMNFKKKNVIIMTNDTDKYYGIAPTLSFSISNFINVIRKCKGLLAKELDLLLLAMIFSDAEICCEEYQNSNSFYLMSALFKSRPIMTKENLNPISAYQYFN